jgi:hypothetical protein
MNAKKTLRKLRGESDRASHSVYISKTIMSEFSKACGDAGHSRVLEELIREFLDDLSIKSRAIIIKKAATKKS